MKGQYDGIIVITFEYVFEMDAHSVEIETRPLKLCTVRICKNSRKWNKYNFLQEINIKMMTLWWNCCSDNWAHHFEFEIDAHLI